MESFDENVWNIMKELGNYERHFNQLEYQYRVLASTWLLAVFSGTGFLLSTGGAIPYWEIVVAFIGFAGATGVSLIWALDLKVYHQLLEAHFVEALKLERENSWLPQSRANMWKEFCGLQNAPRRKLGVLEYVRWFYVVGTMISLLVAVGGVVLFLMNKKCSSISIILAGCGGIFIVVLWAFSIYRQTISPLLEEMSNE